MLDMAFKQASKRAFSTQLVVLKENWGKNVAGPAVLLLCWL